MKVSGSTACAALW